MVQALDTHGINTLLLLFSLDLLTIINIYINEYQLLYPASCFMISCRNKSVIRTGTNPTHLTICRPPCSSPEVTAIAVLIR